MPYKTKRGTWEQARRLGHVPIIESEFVKNRLQTYRIYSDEAVGDVTDDLLVSTERLPDRGPRTEWVLSFDGSSQEVAVKEEYPSTRVGYIQVAGVLVHLEEMRGQSQQLLVDPAVIRKAFRESLLSIVVPSSNVCRDGIATVRDSWRMELYELFKDYNVEGRPILDFYFRLLQLDERTSQSGDEIILNRCSASRSCNASDLAVPKAASTCPQCSGTLYPTDTLRIHEEVQEFNTNTTAMGRLTSVLEHIIMLCYLNYLFERQPRVLSSVAFIIDGPLALFGPQAPLKRAILAYLRFVARELEQRNYSPPLIIGIEKGGQFAEHADQITNHVPNSTLMRLPDDYIFQRILTTRPYASSAFGEDTYYGRKFFYKSAKGQIFTITVPCLDQSILNRHQPDDPACYTTLSSTLALLDQIGTKLYEDAVIPVALAHSFASIPLKTGSRVLTLMSRELLGQAASGAQ
jgi:hypothetical protein